jgi:hypothetical protein
MGEKGVANGEVIKSQICPQAVAEGRGAGRGPCKEMPLPYKYLIKVTYRKKMPSRCLFLHEEVI